MPLTVVVDPSSATRAASDGPGAGTPIKVVCSGVAKGDVDFSIQPFPLTVQPPGTYIAPVLTSVRIPHLSTAEHAAFLIGQALQAYGGLSGGNADAIGNPSTTARGYAIAPFETFPTVGGLGFGQESAPRKSVGWEQTNVNAFAYATDPGHTFTPELRWNFEDMKSGVEYQITGDMDVLTGTGPVVTWRAGANVAGDQDVAVTGAFDVSVVSDADVHFGLRAIINDRDTTTAAEMSNVLIKDLSYYTVTVDATLPPAAPYGFSEGLYGAMSRTDCHGQVIDGLFFYPEGFGSPAITLSTVGDAQFGTATTVVVEVNGEPFTLTWDATQYESTDYSAWDHVKNIIGGELSVRIRVPV